MNRFVPAALGALALSAAASAANVVVNGGFETLDFTGWTQFGDTSASGVSGLHGAYSGLYAAYFGPVTPGGITQTLALSAGDVVNISFALMQEDSDPPHENSFSVEFDGATLATLTDVGPFAYTVYTFDAVVVSADNPSLTFTYENLPSYWDMDVVSVDVVGHVPAMPLPSAAGLGALGLSLVALRRRR